MFGLKDKVLAYIGGGLALALLIALTVVTLTKNATIRALEEQVEQIDGERMRCVADKATLQGNQSRLEASITEQNRSVEAAAAAAEGKYQQAAAERVAASDAAMSAQQKAALIASAKLKDQAGLAAATDALILESLK